MNEYVTLEIPLDELVTLGDIAVKFALPQEYHPKFYKDVVFLDSKDNVARVMVVYDV